MFRCFSSLLPAAFACLLSACASSATHPKASRAADAAAAANADGGTAPLSLAGRRRVLSGMLALVEAQHTFCVHIMHGDRFARNIRELGSGAEPGGTLMLRDVWNADADALQAPLEGWCFQVRPLATNVTGRKDGFAVAAFPAPRTEAAGVHSPIFLTLVPSAQGGLPAMLAADTWEVRDTPLVKRLRDALRLQEPLNEAVVAACAPSPKNTTRVLHHFTPDSPQ
ncbi:hypothetical protein [Prosthecobacter sp.]|uniref:hypothetical protein n=1 Tax=Prosthecobacter sp. TaxID=1965333 RepID=UPI0037844DA7